jgi:hypothetical protein
MSEETKKVAENEEAKVETEETAPAAEEAVEAKETPTEETTEEKAEETPAEETTEEAPVEETTEEKAEEAPVEEEETTEEETKEEAPAEEEAKAKPKTTLRFLLLIILLTVAWFAWNKHQRDAKFNNLIEMADKGNLAEAAAGFRKLMNESSGHLQKRCKQELVRVIIEQGEQPSNNVQQSVVFYRQAYTVDPKALEIHQLRSILNQLKKDKTDKSIDPEMAKGIDAEMTAIKALIKAKIDEGIAKEKARRAALTPEQRKAEDDAAKAAAEEAKKMK